jgi:hypothetical protein
LGVCEKCRHRPTKDRAGSEETARFLLDSLNPLDVFGFGDEKDTSVSLKDDFTRDARSHDVYFPIPFMIPPPIYNSGSLNFY